MLQDIRANTQGTVAKIIIGLIVISFSIFGIESLLFSGGSSGVADVNGEEISPFALQQEVSVQQRRLLALLGDEADPALLDQAQMTQQALETLVQREIVKQAAADFDMRTSDATIADMIGGMEQFQIDGQFSRDMFQSALASAGFTPALFRQRLAEDIQIGQLRAGLAGSDFSTPAEVALSARVSFEGRDVRYITLPMEFFVESVEVNEEDMQAYYEANTDSFMSDERFVVEYLELGIDNYRQSIDEQRLRDEFELVRDEFELSTEARVSHILFEGSADERAEKVQEAQDAIAGGMSFAEAAETFSEDVGSSQLGGDLGYTAGDTFPDAMEAAIATLEVGAQSGPVETDAGTHLLLVTDRRDGSSVAFEDVAAQLEARIQQSEAAAALLLDVEKLRDVAFNAADLTAPAEELGVTVQRTDAFALADAEGVLASPRVQQALLSEDVLDAGHNSEVVEVNAEQFVVLRLAEQQPPSLLPFDAVREDIEAELRSAAASAAASAEAERLLAALEGGQSLEDVANDAGFDWQVEFAARRDSPRLPAGVRERLFELPAPTSDRSRFAIVEDAGDSTYLMEFSRVIPTEPESLPPQQRNLLAQRIAGESGGLLQQQFETLLRDRAEVVVY